jgi:hypothetical protein
MKTMGKFNWEEIESIYDRPTPSRIVSEYDYLVSVHKRLVILEERVASIEERLVWIEQTWK